MILFISLSIAISYMVISWVLGVIFVLTTYDQHFSFKDLFANGQNLFYIFIIFPLITWLILILMVAFYLFLGSFNLLEKIDALRE